MYRSRIIPYCVCRDSTVFLDRRKSQENYVLRSGNTVESLS
jgi:hypothetical protein